MKRLTLIIIMPITVLILLTSCNPDQFVLHEKEAVQTYGVIMSENLDCIDVVRDNGFLLFKGCRVGMRIPGLTQMHADLTVNIAEGSGIKLYFRTIKNRFEEMPKLTFDYTIDGSRVLENDSLVVAVDSIKAYTGNEARIHIFNDGDIYGITVDCDTVFYGRTILKAAEWLVIENYRDTESIFSGIKIDEVIEK